MQRFLSSIAATTLALAGALVLGPGCIVGTQVGSDGQGGGATTSTSTTGGEGGCAMESPSGQACGGNVYPPKPPCAAGLDCVHPGGNLDATGTCAPPGTQVSGPGGECTGFLATPHICAWDHVCTFAPDAVSDQGGTCVKSCSTSTGG